jgi:RimJ/RimL family protein N-acetyltransferase
MLSARGRRVALVPLSDPHLEKTREWANDPELMRLLDRSRPVTPDEHKSWFEELQSAHDRVYMAIEHIESGKHIGNVWLWSIDERHRKAELRIVIGDAAHTGHGAGSEAIDLMCRVAFRELGLRRVYAYVLSFNNRALRAFHRAGFTTEGILKGDRLTESGPVDVNVLARLED